jgi:hypothetical protein
MVFPCAMGVSQWNFLCSIGSPACSLDVPTTLSAWCGENLRGSCTTFFEGAFPSCILLVFLARFYPHHAPHIPLVVGRSPSSCSVYKPLQIVAPLQRVWYKKASMDHTL